MKTRAKDLHFKPLDEAPIATTPVIPTVVVGVFKGGTWKTAIATALAERLAWAGLIVLLITSDKQLDARRRLGLMEERTTAPTARRGEGTVTVLGASPQRTIDLLYRGALAEVGRFDVVIVDTAPVERAGSLPGVLLIVPVDGTDGLANAAHMLRRTPHNSHVVLVRVGRSEPEVRATQAVDALAAAGVEGGQYVAAPIPRSGISSVLSTRAHRSGGSRGGATRPSSSAWSTCWPSRSGGGSGRARHVRGCPLPSASCPSSRTGKAMTRKGSPDDLAGRLATEFAVRDRLTSDEVWHGRHSPEENDLDAALRTLGAGDVRDVGRAGTAPDRRGAGVEDPSVSGSGQVAVVSCAEMDRLVEAVTHLTAEVMALKDLGSREIHPSGESTPAWLLDAAGAPEEYGAPDRGRISVCVRVRPEGYAELKRVREQQRLPTVAGAWEFVLRLGLAAAARVPRVDLTTATRRSRGKRVPSPRI